MGHELKVKVLNLQLSALDDCAVLFQSTQAEHFVVNTRAFARAKNSKRLQHNPASRRTGPLQLV